MQRRQRRYLASLSLVQPCPAPAITDPRAPIAVPLPRTWSLSSVAPRCTGVACGVRRAAGRARLAVSLCPPGRPPCCLAVSLGRRLAPPRGKGREPPVGPRCSGPPPPTGLEECRCNEPTNQPHCLICHLLACSSLPTCSHGFLSLHRFSPNPPFSLNSLNTM